ncbi:MAG: PD-(D/E)XK nuclease family protein [Bacilli bacterium]|nr:PD-(D/E)XK nuclease family protein [Bacilli bacterium]
MKVVIAPKKMHKSILRAMREGDPFFDVKLISKNELEKYYYSSVKKEAIAYLMKNYGLSYEASKMFISYLPYVQKGSNSKLLYLFSLKEDLEKHDFFEKYSFPINPYINIEADVIGYNEHDRELTDLLTKLNCKPNYIYNISKDIKRSFLYFEKVEEEAYFVLNSIANLLNNGVDISKIYIFSRDHIYDYYLKKYAPTFGYQLNIGSDDNYAYTGAFKEFSGLYSECRDVKIALEELKTLMGEDEIYQDLASLLEENIIEGFDYDEQYDYFFNVAKEKKLKDDRYDKAVEIISSPLYIKDSYIFVMGFTQGKYPRSGKDSEYLNYEEVHLLGRNNAKDETKIDEQELMNFFYSENEFYFSYSKKSVKGNYFSSPLVRKLNMKEKKGEVDQNYYSKEVLSYIYAGLKDLENFYKERKDDFYRIRDVISIDYNNYDNAYKPRANVYNKNSKLVLSTSQIDLYYKCPFHYYLSKIIKLDEFDETRATRLGNVAHHMFEHQRDEDFNFDREFEQEISQYQFENVEKLLLTTKLKEQIKTAVESNRLREKYYKNPEIYNELELTYNLDDKTKIIGKIDNLVTLDNKYFICIDYKTGSASSTKFSDDKLKYGVSTQLPTYTLLTSEDERFEGLEIIGIYLNHVISNELSIQKDEDSLIYDYLKLHGKSINDLDMFVYIDSTIADGKSSFVASININKSGALSSRGGGLVSSEQFEEYKTITEQLFKDAATSIRENDFEIRPIYFNDNDEACMYCPFKDICFRKVEQYKVIVKEEESGEEQ